MKNLDVSGQIPTTSVLVVDLHTFDPYEMDPLHQTNVHLLAFCLRVDGRWSQIDWLKDGDGAYIVDDGVGEDDLSDFVRESREKAKRTGLPFLEPDMAELKREVDALRK